MEVVKGSDIVANDHDFAIDHRASRQLIDGWCKLREIAQEGFLVARIDAAVGVRPHNRAEPVPFRLVGKVAFRPLF